MGMGSGARSSWPVAVRGLGVRRRPTAVAAHGKVARHHLAHVHVNSRCAGDTHPLPNPTQGFQSNTAL
eukprot:782386-Alexandrium_andersonii.AAC.1